MNNKEQILTDFSTKIISNQQNIDSEYVELVNENFWSLLSEDKPGNNNFEPKSHVSDDINSSVYKIMSDWTKLVEKQKEPIEDTYSELDVLPGVVFKNLELKSIDLPTESKFYESNFKLTFEYPTF